MTSSSIDAIMWRSQNRLEVDDSLKVFSETKCLLHLRLAKDEWTGREELERFSGSSSTVSSSGTEVFLSDESICGAPFVWSAMAEEGWDSLEASVGSDGSDGGQPGDGSTNCAASFSMMF